MGNELPPVAVQIVKRNWKGAGTKTRDEIGEDSEDDLHIGSI